MLLFTVTILVGISLPGEGRKYTPDWNSLDSRPLPSWYDEAKVGIFVHWGPYSVPGVVSEWFWFYYHRNDPTKDTDIEVNKYMKDNFPPGFGYQEFAKDFKAEFFNATEWEETIAMSGAQYFVITTKHHDGFAMWPSSRNFGWNARDVGPKRDIIGELEQAFRKNGRVRFGLYHSLFEWFNPLYLADQAANSSTDFFLTDKVMPELMELIHTYRPEVLWSDGEAGATAEYWRAKEFLAWLYSQSPVKESVVTNDRWGIGTQCKHGDFFTCADRYNPGTLQGHKWENAMTLDTRSWGNRRDMELDDVLTMSELLTTLASTISCGGNILINIGPTKEGTIPTIFQARLSQLGGWLAVNGEAVYGSTPWLHQNDSLAGNVWYTSRNSNDATRGFSPGGNSSLAVFAFLPAWPAAGTVQLRDIAPYLAPASSRASLLGADRQPMEFVVHAKDRVELLLPARDTVRSDWTFVIKFQNLRQINIWP